MLNVKGVLFSTKGLYANKKVILETHEAKAKHFLLQLNGRRTTDEMCSI